MPDRLALALALFAVLPACAGAPADTIEIQLVGGRAFELRGVDAAKIECFPRRFGHWNRLFSIRVATGDDVPAMAGRYEVEGGVLRFTPAFPLAGGLHYRAVFAGEQLGNARVEREFAIPESDPGPRIAVREIYPTGEVLPENLLRFYVQFTGQMTQGGSYEHVWLLDGEGKKIKLPFLEIGEELWDRSGTRLTLLVDPGRVKNLLLPRRVLGPVFDAGKDYTLVVSASFKDAHGRRLARPFRRAIHIRAVDDRQPDPKSWKVETPRGDTRDPLDVTFPEPIDHALLHHMIDVVDPTGSRIDGTISVTAHETRWTFRPTRPWPRGTHALVVDEELEDPCGNSVRAPFEVDVVGKTARQLPKHTTRIPFTIR